MKNKISNKVDLKNRRQCLRKNNTKAEFFFWTYLSDKKFCNLKFRRQHSFQNYIVDFYCRELKLVIEVDGDTHFGVEANLYDNQRTKYLQSLGLVVVRFRNDEILFDLENCLKKIESLVCTPPNLPSKEKRN